MPFFATFASFAVKSFSIGILGTLLLLSVTVVGQPTVKPIGPNLYAYISDNDSSANSTFLVGEKGILVVDTGLNATEGNKLLTKIREISALPIAYIVNTHYHPDHQGGNSTVGPNAVVITTDFTRERTLQIMNAPAMKDFHFQPANLTFREGVTLHLDPYTVEIYSPGKGHTLGDALVYFPAQHAIAMGDLFLNRSCPAMDDGSAENWIHTLEQVLQKPLDHVVPGHFELATKPDLQRFHDYLSDLFQQVKTLRQKGETLDQVRHDIDMKKYSDFRQYPKFEATFSDNAATIYQQLQAH
ncbi:MAG TPA: MBL fold metallo-hydrolase [Terriglobales bacterium]|nr:MBL fold metallo-hydrolase [Terriglobales bacterium]